MSAPDVGRLIPLEAIREFVAIHEIGPQSPVCAVGSQATSWPWIARELLTRLDAANSRATRHAGQAYQALLENRRLAQALEAMHMDRDRAERRLIEQAEGIARAIEASVRSDRAMYGRSPDFEHGEDSRAKSDAVIARNYVGQP